MAEQTHDAVVEDSEVEQTPEQLAAINANNAKLAAKMPKMIAQEMQTIQAEK